MEPSLQHHAPPSIQPPYPRAAAAWYLVGVLIVANILSFVDRQILALLIGPIRADLGISDTAISLLHGFAFTILYSCLGLPLGRYVDRGGRRTLIVAGVLVWSVMTMACGLADSYWQLFAARIGVGIGEAALAPAAYSMIADTFRPERRGVALGVYTSGIYLGIGAALTLGGLVIAATSQRPEVSLPLVGTVRAWQAAFLLVGLPGLLAAPLILTLREPARRAVPGRTGTVGPEDALRYLAANRRTFLFTFLAYDCFALAAYAVGTWVPTLFIRIHHWTIAEAGLFYGATIMATGLAGGVVGGLFGDRLTAGRQDGRLRLSILCVPAWMAAVALAAATGNPWLALAAFGVSGFFSSVLNCIGPTVVQDMTPSRLRGQATAFYFFAQNLLSLTVGPTAVALVTDHVFGDPAALPRSMAVIALPAILLGGLFAHVARAPFRRTRAALGEPIGAEIVPVFRR